MIFGDAFDRGLGVDTAAPVSASALGIDSRRDYWYEVTPVEAFEHLVGGASIDFSRFAFIDLGCGKGRPLLLAASLPFRCIIGVERCPALCAVARRNIQVLNPAQRARCKVICADAAQFVFPSGPLLIYLYNPFGVDVLRTVLATLRESVAREPRELMIVYLNSVHGTVLHASSWLRRTRMARFVNAQADREEVGESFVATPLPPT